MKALMARWLEALATSFEPVAWPPACDVWLEAELYRNGEPMVPIPAVESLADTRGHAAADPLDRGFAAPVAEHGGGA